MTSIMSATRMLSYMQPYIHSFIDAGSSALDGHPLPPGQFTHALLNRLVLSMLARLAGPGLGSSVTSQGVVIEVHTQSWSFRDGDNPQLVGLDRPVEQLGPQGVRVLVELEQIRVGERGDEVEVRRQAHRGGEHMRHARQAGSHGQRRDPPASGYAPRPDDVGLHYIYCSIGYEVPEAC